MKIVEYSVIVPFYDNKNILDMCLRNLFAAMPKVEYELLIVNDNPDRILNPRYGKKLKMRVVNNPENKGYGYACNVGAEHARGEHLIFVDSDLIPQSAWFKEILKTKERIGDFGSIGSKILDLSTGRLLHFGVAFYEIDVINPFQYAPPECPFTMKDKSFQAVPSGVMLINRELFVSMEGFDARLYNAYTDLDLCCRLNREGRETWVSSKSIAYHRGMVSGKVRYAFHSDVKTLFFRRWGSKLENDGLDILRYSCSLFNENKPLKEGKYLAINLSNSLYFHDYIDTLEESLNIEVIQTYSLPTLDRKKPHIRLEDRLPWDLCRLGVPLVYFTDNFMALRSNRFWFDNRSNQNDIISDKNGNLLMARTLDKC